MDDESKIPNGGLINEKSVLILSIFIAGLCSIVYELLISTTSSYFLGDSVRQFSLTIGIYMASMGLGAYLSRLTQTDLLSKFILAEILLGLVGGSSVPLLYFFFANLNYWGFMCMMVLLILVIGILTGLSIPLLTRIMEVYYPLKINLSNVLSLDYLGALAATLIFPFVLLPWLGTFRSSLIFGIINLSIGFINLWYFTNILKSPKRKIYHLANWAVTIYFGLMLFFAQGILDRWNDALYPDNIIFHEQTPFQHLVMTKGGKDIRFYIDRAIQWSSVDEYRYYESLVHLPMSLSQAHGRVLVFGGADGLALREILKYPEVEKITVVDIDPDVFRLGLENPILRRINGGSLEHPKVHQVVRDAFLFLQERTQVFDVIICDLPDPNNESRARLYSREFYRVARQRLSPFGILSTQATSPYYSNKAFWCINRSVREGGFRFTYPYHTYVPSFGDRGFLLAANRPLNTENIHIDIHTQFLDRVVAQRLFTFEKDLLPDTIDFNTLDRPVLLDYYLNDRRSLDKILDARY